MVGLGSSCRGQSARTSILKSILFPVSITAKERKHLKMVIWTDLTVRGSFGLILGRAEGPGLAGALILISVT